MMLEQSNLDIEIQECPICKDNKELFELGCKHKFCRQCVQKYLNGKIDDGIVMQIRCPTCSYEIQYDEVVFNIDEKEREKYARFRTMLFAEKDPTVRHCPNKDCELYVQLQQKRCDCGTEICINCGNKSHGLTGCKDLMDSIFVLDSRQEKIQRCPKCKVIVQKEGGCNHMTCKRCQYQFCWICGRHYTSKHYNTYNYYFGCPSKQYSNVLPWKYPLFNKIFPFLLTFILLPLIVSLGFAFLILQPFGGAYYLFNQYDNNVVYRLSCIQKILVGFFIYIIGGVVLYPFVVIYECLFMIFFVIYASVRLLRRLIQKIRDF